MTRAGWAVGAVAATLTATGRVMEASSWLFTATVICIVVFGVALLGGRRWRRSNTPVIGAGALTALLLLPPTSYDPLSGAPWLPAMATVLAIVLLLRPDEAAPLSVITTAMAVAAAAIVGLLAIGWLIASSFGPLQDAVEGHGAYGVLMSALPLLLVVTAVTSISIGVDGFRRARRDEQEDVTT